MNLDEGTYEPRDEHNTFRLTTYTLMKPLTHTMTYESLQLHTLCYALFAYASLSLLMLCSLSPTSLMNFQTFTWSIDS